MNPWLLVLGLMTALLAQAQQAPSSRAEEIQQARRAKAAKLEPDTPSSVERGLAYFQREKILERITAGIAGFRIKFGGLATGSGFALGPEYLRRDLAGGNVVFRGSAAASAQGWQLHDLQVTLPKLAAERLRVDLLAQYRNFAGVNYYGPGPDSKKTGRSAYRLEDTLFDAAAQWRVAGPLRLSGDVGYVKVNVGPGDQNGIVSADRIYTPAQAPGIQRQTDFLKGGVMAQVDWRDFPFGPRRGGNYYVKLTQYSDRTLHLHDFRRIDFEAQQYIPFLNERRVIALRARNSITDTRAGQVVPFYLQPTLGGSDDLRGFRPFRFYDNNAMVFNAEYRWETFSGLDMAIFFDAGKVTSARDRWRLNNLEGSAGFGLRFNVRNGVFMRVDVGFSHEGFQTWVKFNNVF
ncbi:MAG: BamA/TamA family outer membrane protein [Bryobacterales bacterium]|nr:BamA/TamA family outer membrane protein [Bryobacterales bacterium]